MHGSDTEENKKGGMVGARLFADLSNAFVFFS